MADTVPIMRVCAVLELTERRIGQLVNLGMPKAGRGEYVLDDVMIWYIRYLKKELARRGPAGTADGATLQAEKLKLVAAQAERVQMGNAERAGQLLDAEDVRKTWTQLLKNIQQRVRSIPASIGPRLVNITVPAAIVARLKHEIDQSLQELASGSALSQSDRRSRAGDQNPSAAA